ncbi:histidine kinase [Salinadaptatus halalkaliphilus]|uniref:histidine kinase n=1 Tax=Salinadaptatus halalkaliphilus TaxID=2419781 RepID=A0A4S3TRB1_9EURY|nr:GAF domain-containing sensor histidine kinase [Salinadaptatus halalkaliphilus]THE65118.1 histidine kinase [Salinadaptatus halalkaliphilus]
MTTASDGIDVLYVGADDANPPLESFLERDGDQFTLHRATTIPAGNRRLETDAVECVVCEDDLPGATGLEFLERSRDAIGERPFVLIGRQTPPSEAFAAGVTEYVRWDSPDDAAVVGNRVQNAVERTRAKRQQEALQSVSKRNDHEQRLETLHETVRRLMTSDIEREVATVTTDAAREIIDLEVNTVYFYDETADRLVSATETPEGRDLFDEFPTFDRGEGLVWQVFESDEPMIFDDVSEHPDSYNPETPIRSEMILPLGDHGIFIAGTTEDSAFDAKTISLAKILARSVETALDSTARRHELHAQKERLREQNDRLEEFSSIVAHDVRNPISVATGYVELAADETDDVESELAAARRALERSERITDDLLWLARSGQAIGARVETNLADVAETAWRHVQTDGASLEMNGDRLVLADRDRLSQLFENLFRNAVEHGSTDDDGPQGKHDPLVRVGTLEDGFVVEDTGPGLSVANPDTVFELGYTSDDDGTGYGLSIVETIVEAHGWSIAVTESDEGGARFEITGLDSQTKG